MPLASWCILYVYFNHIFSYHCSNHDEIACICLYAVLIDWSLACIQHETSAPGISSSTVGLTASAWLRLCHFSVAPRHSKRLREAFPLWPILLLCHPPQTKGFPRHARKASRSWPPSLPAGCEREPVLEGPWKGKLLGSLQQTFF